MAGYNYYGNYGSPYINYPVNYPQPVQPQVQPIQATQQGQPSIIWISSEYEAERYPVAPNNAITLWSTSEPVVYLKSADATGKPTLKTYDLVERKAAPPATSPPQEDNKVIYATKDDLATVIGAIKSISGDIETMKGDLYGVAGRKKPSTRKTKDEGEDDE